MTDDARKGKEGDLDLKRFYGFVILIIVISLLGGCGIKGTSSNPSANQAFLNQEFHVSLQYL